MDFSPNENYLVTFSPRGEGLDQRKLVLWDILTGEEKRVFYPEGASIWPIFRWSYNDKYVAYMGEDLLSIYETPVTINLFIHFLIFDLFSFNTLIFYSLLDYWIKKVLKFLVSKTSVGRQQIIFLHTGYLKIKMYLQE